jgi:hypothetical protein
MADAEIWQVQLASGGTGAMTLDELDAAFQAGRIDERSKVLAPGALAWSTLGEIAGIDATPAPTPRVSIDCDVDLEALRAPARRWKRIVLIAAPIAAVIGIIATTLASRSSISVSAESAPSPPVGAAPSAPAAIVAASPAPSTTPTPTAAPVLNDAKKRALAAADAKREQAQKSKAIASKARAKTAPSKRKPASSSSPFTKGTDKHDPLNATL